MDIEFAFQEGKLYLLQCRAITTNKERAPELDRLEVQSPLVTMTKVPLFAELNRRQAEQVARLLKRHAYAKGDIVIMEGTGGAAFFLIESGEVSVSRNGNFIETLGPGDCFGEIALLDGGPRTATVIATTDLVCYGLTLWEFKPLLEKNGTIAWRLLQSLAGRLRVLGK